MPYADNIPAVYRIVNKVTNKCYVGQSVNVKKRLKDHFQLLRAGKHHSVKLQRSFDKYGEENFFGDVEFICDDPEELTSVEQMLIDGAMWFEQEPWYNISLVVDAPMRGRRHTEETRKRISQACRNNTQRFGDPEYRKTLSKAQIKRRFEDPNFVAKVKFIVDNDHLTYAERGRQLGIDTSSVRKLALRHAGLKGKL